MERLTKDQIKTNEEFLLNYAYAKNGEIYVRHYAGDNDVNINQIVRELAERGDVTGVLEGVEDEDIFDILKEYSDYFSAVMLYLATQAAELREVVKRYEDAEENEKLPKCKVGDTLFDISYQINESGIAEFEVYKIELENGISYFLYCKELTSLRDRVTNTCFGKTVFFTCEEAEKALKERESE